MTINCKGRLVDLNSPKVMGILNITPNSFYDGGRYDNEKSILQHVSQMLSEGADFIDVGAYSSKPNASFVSELEETSRIAPIIKAIIREFPDAILSVDTFRSAVARAAIENGAAMINDIAAGKLDDAMLQTVAQLQVPYIMMHMRGNPQTMQTLTQYDDLVKEILFYFSERISAARSLGINDLIVDVGFGFAKTVEQNFELMKKLQVFQILEVPLLVGISRKSMITKFLNINISDALNGTTVLNTIALLKGANILRVHDVKEAVEAIRLVRMLG